MKGQILSQLLLLKLYIFISIGSTSRDRIRVNAAEFEEEDCILVPLLVNVRQPVLAEATIRVAPFSISKLSNVLSFETLAFAELLVILK